jgi:hypothetical protein
MMRKKLEVSDALSVGARYRRMDQRVFIAMKWGSSIVSPAPAMSWLY